MKPLIQFKTTIPPLLIALLLVCFGLAPMAQAVGPDTDGTIPGSNNGEGIGVLVSRTSGVWNTGTGFEALNHLTAGNQNTATGLRALFSDTNGGFNTATGVLSLFSNTSGFFNSATGGYSLANNISGNYNTADGYGALYNNNTGDDNTANGYAALYFNTGGELNTATGSFALYRNTTGRTNTANGVQALQNNSNGNSNTANGVDALFSNTAGSSNTAIGENALYNNTTGDDNTALGGLAGSLITGSGNVCIGRGVSGETGENNTTRIRNIYETVQPIVGTDPDYVTINSSGRLGRANISSRRYKHDIKPMDKASELLYALKPVSFRYNKEYDATQMLAFGLIAEEVAEVYPDLVGRNSKAEPESVRYDQINAMLLNEFLKEHRKVEEQAGSIAEFKSVVAQQHKDFQATIAQQQKGMEAIIARLNEQASQIQKVGAQLETAKRAPQVACLSAVASAEGGNNP
jgi:hypothetical protein